MEGLSVHDIPAYRLLNEKRASDSYNRLRIVKDSLLSRVFELYAINLKVHITPMRGSSFWEEGGARTQ